MSVVAEGDRVRDAARRSSSWPTPWPPAAAIATGIGTTGYGAQLVVDAATTDEAVERAMAEFVRAAARAGLPPWPITRVETISEDDDLDEDG